MQDMQTEENKGMFHQALSRMFICLLLWSFRSIYRIPSECQGTMQSMIIFTRDRHMSARLNSEAAACLLPRIPECLGMVSNKVVARTTAQHSELNSEFGVEKGDYCHPSWFSPRQAFESWLFLFSHAWFLFVIGGLSQGWQTQTGFCIHISLLSESKSYPALGEPR